MNKYNINLIGHVGQTLEKALLEANYPKADCGNCKYRWVFVDSHCYKLDVKPGARCEHFRRGN